MYMYMYIIHIYRDIPKIESFELFRRLLRWRSRFPTGLAQSSPGHHRPQRSFVGLKYVISCKQGYNMYIYIYVYTYTYIYIYVNIINHPMLHGPQLT